MLYIPDWGRFFRRLAATGLVTVARGFPLTIAMKTFGDQPVALRACADRMWRCPTRLHRFGGIEEITSLPRQHNYLFVAMSAAVLDGFWYGVWLRPNDAAPYYPAVILCGDFDTL